MFHYNESIRVQDITVEWGAGCCDWNRAVVYKRIVLPGSAGPHGLSVKGGSTKLLYRVCLGNTVKWNACGRPAGR